MPVLNIVKSSIRNFSIDCEQSPLFKRRITLPNYKKIPLNTSRKNRPFEAVDLIDRAEKINQIKTKIKSGEYVVEASKVAKAMLKDLIATSF